MKELKEDEFADLYAEELQAAGEEKISGENFVDECQVESDLESVSYTHLDVYKRQFQLFASGFHFF